MPSEEGGNALLVGSVENSWSASASGTGNSCELYDVGLNKWADLPKLNTKRHYHSSCVFENSSLFVFCGINNDNRAYVNTIERLDVSMF